MNNKNHLEPDLNVAAYLLTRGFPLRRLERVGRRYAFSFASEATEPAMEYRSASTPEARAARDFANAVKRLKDEMYSAKFQETQYYEDTFKDGNENGTEHSRR